MLCFCEELIQQARETEGSNVEYHVMEAEAIDAEVLGGEPIFIINPAAGKTDKTAEYTANIQKSCAGLDYVIAVSQGAPASVVWNMSIISLSQVQ